MNPSRLEPCLKAVQLLPRDALPYFNLGNALHKLERYEEAEMNYQKALKINPKFVEAHFNRGVALDELGRGCCGPWRSQA